MVALSEKRFSFFALIFLLFVSPLMRGAHPDWAALGIAAGIFSLLTFRFAAALLRGRISFLFSAADLVLALFFLWTLAALKRPLSPPDAFVVYLELLAAAGFFFLSRKMVYDEVPPVTFLLCLSAIAGGAVFFGILQLLKKRRHYQPKQRHSAG